MITARSNKKGLALSTSKGFTLIELMIVIAVIAILATLALFGLNGVQKGARDTQRLALINNMRTAIERYNSDNNKYPTGAFNAVIASLTTGGYITNIAFDPGCGGGAQTLTAASYTNGNWIPCQTGAAASGPVTYSINAGTSGYTILLVKEANGQTVSLVGPQ